MGRGEIKSRDGEGGILQASVWHQRSPEGDLTWYVQGLAGTPILFMGKMGDGGRR